MRSPYQHVVAAGLIALFTLSALAQQRPFAGTPRAIPGRIEAEDYDEGGEGVAYHDNDPRNEGRQYRKGDGADIGQCNDADGNYHIGWFRQGEWLEYTTNVTGGTYDVNFRVASAGTALLVKLEDKELGTLKVPRIGWGKWQTISLPKVTVPDGQGLILRLEVTGNLGVNLNWFEFVPAGTGARPSSAGTGEFNVPKTADPSKITGAHVDETQIRQTLHVNAASPAADDGNPGTEDKPVRTFVAALERAKALLKDGTPTRILLHPGTYRETNLGLNGEEIGGQAADTLLVIEGLRKGEVILSGSEVAGWEHQTWTLVDADKRICKHIWNHNWGPVATGWYKPEKVIGQRREMVFLDGKPLRQVLIEDMDWRRPKQEDFDQYGMKNVSKPAEAGRQAEGKSYIYKGYRGPAILQPGEFGVAELGPGETIKEIPYDDHPDPNAIFIRLPEGMDTLRDVTVEVSLAIDRPNQALWIRNKSNLVLRNIVFQHYGMECTRGLFRTHEFREHAKAHDWLIEDCESRHNNGSGFGLCWITNLTIRRCSFHHNGGQGLGLAHVRNALLEDVDVSHNAWRNAMADFHDHACGGLNFSGMDLLFRRVTACHNGTGFGCRGDQNGINIIFEDCNFSDNHGLNGGGLFAEIMTGPFLLHNCELSRNPRGLLILNSYNMTVDNCQLVDNAETAVALVVMKNRSTADYFSLFSDQPEAQFPIPGIRGLSITDSVLATSRGPKAMLFTSPGDGLPQGFYQTELRVSGNRYYNGENAEAFSVAVGARKPQSVDFAAWQKLTGQDTDSTWQAPAP